MQIQQIHPSPSPRDATVSFRGQCASSDQDGRPKFDDMLKEVHCIFRDWPKLASGGHVDMPHLHIMASLEGVNFYHEKPSFAFSNGRRVR